MIKTSRCSLRSCNAARALLFGLAFAGASGGEARADSTSFDDSQAPRLLARRGAKGPLPAGKSCEDLEQAFLGSRKAPAAVLSELGKVWEPWGEDDREEIGECSRIPCKVKLDGAEVAKLGAKPRGERLAAYLGLVMERAEQYRKENKPRDYEFAASEYGAIEEPFSALAKQLSVEAAPPGPGTLEARKLVAGASSAPGGSKGRVVRQIVERRQRKSARKAEIWIRSVYTEHFFDAWGEWASFSCGPDGWRWDGAILVEVDLLKKKDFFSRIGRGKMKSTSETVMQDELSRWQGQTIR